MHNKKLFIIIFIVFIIMSIISSLILLNGNTILKNFKILKVTNENTNYTIKHEKVKAAVSYRITIHDENDIKIYDSETKDTTNTISLNNLEYDNNYSLMIYAIDALGESRPAEKPVIFKWNEPSLEYDSILLNNEDKELNILGDLSSSLYEIECIFNDEIKTKEEIKEENYVIKKELFFNQTGELIVNIKHKNEIVYTKTFYNNKNPITELKITSIENNATLKYNDVYLEYEGGDNSTKTIIKVYEKKNLIKTSETNKRKVILSKNLFKTSESYKVEIISQIGDYSKSAVVNFNMSEKEQLKPVYISNNWTHVKKGSKITLECPDKNAKIYYTIDGNNPESFGIPYTEPIVVNENMILKTVAVEDNKNNSIVKTYNINVSDINELKVYISPSNQSKNYGAKEALYTNERDEMNDLSNYIIERLISHGVKVKRNNSSGNINLWLKESNYYGANLHIAIHSNASVNHSVNGIETWIHSETSDTYSLANIIQNDLMSIYPYKEDEKTNRGVKYALGALGEVNDNYLPFGILVEVAHHDYYEDALWIMQNKKLIGYNIADSILKYYQIID